MYEFLTWTLFEDACQEIVKKIKKARKDFDGIYGIPRGGLPLAVKLSNLLSLPLIINNKEITKKTLIVDDISDTGRTLEPFKDHFIVTIYYHKQSTVIPNIWIFEKTDKWIIFPWEIK